MSKKLLFILASAILVAAISIPVLACGHHGSKTASSSYTVCSIQSCVKSDIHSHNGKYYYAHSYEDGHSYHEYCDVEDCALSGYHKHDSTYCFGHTEDDGHNHRRMRSKHH